MNLKLNIVLENRDEERQICPYCGTQTLFKYIDIVTKEIIPGENGYCIGGNNCGYHVFPKSISQTIISEKEKELLKFGYKFDRYNSFPVSYDKFTYSIPSYRVLNSIQGFNRTNFGKFLISFLKHDAMYLLLSYYVGDDFEPLLGGELHENVFWRIDNNFIVRHGLITDYLPNGKRIKAVPQDEYTYNEYYAVSFFNCFFGAHLINVYPDKDIAIVEDEKTAIVCSHFWPEYNWLATGKIESLNWIDYRVYNILFGKNVTLYADNKSPVFFSSRIDWDYWLEMANFIKNEIDCTINVKFLIDDKIKTLNDEDQLLILALLQH